MKKYVENKENNNEKGSPKYETENANKVKNEPKLNVDEQQDAIKHLKEYWDIDDIEPPSKIGLRVKHVINHLHEKMVGKTYSGKVH